MNVLLIVLTTICSSKIEKKGIKILLTEVVFDGEQIDYDDYWKYDSKDRAYVTSNNRSADTRHN